MCEPMNPAPPVTMMRTARGHSAATNPFPRRPTSQWNGVRAPLVVPAVLFVAAILVARDLQGAAPLASTEVPDVVVQGIVAGDVTAERWGDAFELLARNGTRYLVSTHESVSAGERLQLRG